MPEDSVACWGWRSRVGSCRAATRLAHQSSLSVSCLFSISFVWILGTRVIRFKVKTRQRDKKKKSRSFPRSPFQTSPGIPELLLTGQSSHASQHAQGKGLGQMESCRREVSSRPLLCVTVYVQGHSSAHGGPLSDSWAPRQRAQEERPCLRTLPSPHLFHSCTPLKSPGPKMYQEITQSHITNLD